MPVEDVIIDEQPFLYIQGANDPLPTQSTGGTGDGLLFESGVASTLTALAVASSVGAGNLFYIVQAGAPKSLDYTVLLSSLNVSLASSYLPLSGGTVAGALAVTGAFTVGGASVVRNQTGINGLTGGGAANLDGIVTVGLAVGARVVVSIASAPPTNYSLRALTVAEAAPYFVRPDDYAAGTNEKVWVYQDVLFVDRTTSINWNPYADAGVFHFYIGSGINVDAASLTQAGLFSAASIALTGAMTALNVVLSQTVLTYAATTDINFDLAGLRTLALTGNVTFTTSNRGSGKTVTIKILCDATPRTFTFPAWKWVGTAPTGIAASKTGILSVSCFGSADTDVVAAYAVEA